jgi:hypothetical protein
MQSIAIPASSYCVAAERTENIPEHAIEISGPLIEIGKKNLAEWGITTAAVDSIIERGVGIPIRVCNDLDPHACDLANDNYSQVGYTTKMWQDGNWIHASAAVTKPAAAGLISNGTWTPFGQGSWSATGTVEQVTADFEQTGMLEQMMPQSIALFTPPAKPAYTGSKFEMVAAAVMHAAEWSTAYINSLPDSSFAYIESCYGETSDNKNLRHLPYKDNDGKIDLPHLRNALSRVKQVKLSCDADKEKQDTIISNTERMLRKLLDEATKTATAPLNQQVTNMTEIDIETPGTLVPADAPPVVEPPAVTPSPIPDAAPELTEPDAFTQEDLDDAVKFALEKQKADYDAEIVKMTPNDDLQPMFASVKADTIDEIKRASLVDRYVELVTASSVLSAPYRVDGNIDATKLSAKRADMMTLKTASVEQAITDAEVMVAAMPAGKTAFDDATVPSHTQDAGFAADMQKLGVTAVEFL